MRPVTLRSNANWVCFACRSAERRPPSYRAESVVVACRACREPTCCIGKKLRVPRRLDVRGWRALHASMVQWERAAEVARAYWAARREGAFARAPRPRKPAAVTAR